MADLQREVFGPVLHLLRYPRQRLAATLQALNATGYGLTQGVHTRIDETVAQVLAASSAGNVYVNRNIVGAVVGVQPFGGQGLSGTGPKAGGPLYLLRLLSASPVQAARLAVAHSGPAATPPVRGMAAADRSESSANALRHLRAWAQSQGLGLLAAQCDQAYAESPVGPWHSLPGPTGEANLYAVLPRDAVLCLVDDDGHRGGHANRRAGSRANSRAGSEPGAAADGDRLAQLAAVLAVGSHAVWPASAHALRERLPLDVREHISLASDWTQPSVHFDAVLHHGDAPALLAVAAQLAQRVGPIVGLTGMAHGELRVPLQRLVIERSLCINTAAAGGNASLMTLA